MIWRLVGSYLYPKFDIGLLDQRGKGVLWTPVNGCPQCDISCGDTVKQN